MISLFDLDCLEGKKFKMYSSPSIDYLHDFLKINVNFEG